MTAKQTDIDPVLEKWIAENECTVPQQMFAGAGPTQVVTVQSLRTFLSGKRIVEDVPVAVNGPSAAPCSKCGYNGPGYYQPATHPCAAPSDASGVENG